MASNSPNLAATDSVEDGSDNGKTAELPCMSGDAASEVPDNHNQNDSSFKRLRETKMAEIETINITDSNEKKKKDMTEEINCQDHHYEKKIQEFWSVKDEITLLRGYLDYTSKYAHDPKGFHHYIKDSLTIKASSSSQVSEKLSLLKRYYHKKEKDVELNNSKFISFPSPADHQLYDLSSKIWKASANNNSCGIGVGTSGGGDGLWPLIEGEGKFYTDQFLNYIKNKLGLNPRPIEESLMKKLENEWATMKMAEYNFRRKKAKFETQIQMLVHQHYQLLVDNED